MEKNKTKTQPAQKERKITRKEAIAKGMGLIGLSAATFMVLSPKKTQAQSPVDPPPF